MHAVSLLCMLRRSLRVFLCGMPCQCSTIRHYSSVMWQLERDTSHVLIGLEYPKGIRLGIDQGYGWPIYSVGMTSFCSYGIGYCLAGRENCFQHSDNSAGYEGEGNRPHRISL